MMVRKAEPQQFRRALSSFATGVIVITVWDSDERPYGMTANAFSSVSVDPMLVLACLNKSTYTHRRVVEEGRFGINILKEDAQHISNFCARSGSSKLLDREWLCEDASLGTPALNDALAYLDCTVYAKHEAGTHSIFVGRVESISLREEGDQPLVYFQGGYHRIEDSASVAS